MTAPALVPADPALRTVETHTALLLFSGDRVYKVKKAVDLGFLDHRDREARRRACEDEVRLNRRLAPDVYLGVADLVGPGGETWDHMVVMRRMPEDRSLSRCVVAGEDVEEPLRRIAAAVADLHAQGGVSAAAAAPGTGAALLGRWRDSFASLRDHGVATDDSRAIEDLVERYHAGRAPLFAARVAEGHVRDGHGDLMADDVYLLPDGPRVLDCIDFSDEYRIADVVADVAFLAMDLERLGRADLAERFLALYGEASGTTWPSTLADHMVAYRAHVRAKVRALRGAQQVEGGHGGVDDLLALARRHLERADVRLVLVGGLPGTGKSTVASAVADDLGAVVLRSDEVRRRMPEPEGDRYAPTAVRAVYDRMVAEAEELLGLGHHVVLDATWTDDGPRQAARAAAERTASTAVEVRCVAPAEVAAARIEARGRDPHGSEATPAVAAAMAQRCAPWPEATDIDTSGPAERSAAAALDAVRVRRR